MKYKIKVEGKDGFKVNLQDNIDFTLPIEAQIDGENHIVEFINFDNEGNVKSMIIDGVFYDVEVEKEDNIINSVVLNGQKYEIEFQKIGRERFIVKKEKEKSGKIYSVIPGKILNISVKQGDKVKEGDLILILEAMKMENEILAPKSGIVKRIYVNEGDNVEKGVLMVEIE